MKKLLLLTLLCGICAAQTTPNLGLNIPPPGTLNWGPLMNQNMSIIDSINPVGKAANSTFTGTNFMCSINSVSYVGGSCATTWGNGDIGAQINAAYAACPASPSYCPITIIGQNSTYSFSTPIVFNTAGKLPLLDLGGNVLNYTPTTATIAINLNYGSPFVNGGSQSHGVRNGVLQNNGCQAGNNCGGYTASTSAVGIQLSTISPATGTIGPDISNLVVSGFNLALNVPTGNNLLWGANLRNDQFSSNNAGIQCSSGGVYESMQLYGVRFTVNKNGLLNDCNGDIYVHGGSFDQNDDAINQEAGHTDVVGTHFEMNAASSIVFGAVTGGSLTISESDFQDDNTTGNITNWFSCSNPAGIDWGPGNHIFSGGRTTTNVFNISTSCNLTAIAGISTDSASVLPISSLVGGTGTNNAYYFNDGTASHSMLNVNGIASIGPAAALTGTGACATITTQTGGKWVGSAKCTGTTGASTLTITPGGTEPNGWVCNVQDETTRANVFQQTSHSPTTCVLTVTSVTQNDVFVFTAIAF